MHKTRINNWITLLVVTAALFIKSVFLRQIMEMDTLGSGQLVAAYLSVGAVSLGLALLSWLPRRWPVVMLMLLTDLWFIAGIWYYHANFIWLNWQAVRTITELKGFESSILAYMRWQQLVLPLSTLVSLITLFAFPVTRPQRRHLMPVVLTVCVLTLGGIAVRALNPLTEEDRQQSFHAEQSYYLRTHSPLAQVGYILYEAVQDGLFRWHASQPFTEREQAIMAAVYRPGAASQAPQGHLVYILVESLETWALEAQDQTGQPVGAHILSYIDTHPVLYVPAVETQQVYGRSGDGQLITQTGLLPVTAGVTCQQYGTNTYPNLAHFYADGAVINPYFIPVWNQRVVTHSYGFRQLLGPRSLVNMKDSMVMERTRDYLTQAQEPSMVLALTIDTHTPFRTRRDSIPLDDRYSRVEQDYLRSVHYTDRQIGRFLQWADTAAVMRHATIVITADHNHFQRVNGHGLCPFIMASPCIFRPVRHPAALQMDIYPTVLHAIGQTDYEWRGLGIDLLDENAQSLLEHRPIRPEEAYSLSDKLIQTNFFAQ